MPIVAVSGSQGAGKTTVLSALHKAGYPIIQRKTSRSILNEWNVSLSEVNNNPDLTKKFQEEIIKRKFMDEKEAMISDDIVFTERTYGDLFAYALVALGKDNEFSDWLSDYYLQCMEYQQSYDLVFYLTAGHFDVQADGVRATNRHYSKMVDLVMGEFTKQLTPSQRLNIIDTPVLQERLTMIDVQTQATLNPAQYRVQLLQNL
jgi:predicted ATPase